MRPSGFEFILERWNDQRTIDHGWESRIVQDRTSKGNRSGHRTLASCEPVVDYHSNSPLALWKRYLDAVSMCIYPSNKQH
jgi:hypothetical protein